MDDDDSSSMCACARTHIYAPPPPPSTGNGVFRSGHPVTLFIDRCLSPPPSFGTPTRNEVVVESSSSKYHFSPFDRNVNSVTYFRLFRICCLSDIIFFEKDRSGEIRVKTNSEDFHLPRTWGYEIDRGQPFVRSWKGKSIDPNRDGII